MPRHNLFSNSEMTDMISVYVQQGFSTRAAARSYADIYPHRRQPNRKLFSCLFSRLRETGNFRPKRHYGRPVVRTAQQEEMVLDLVKDDPTTSIRRISTNVGLNQRTVFNILHEQQLYPYHFTPVQNLLPGDLLARTNFCEFVLNKMRQYPLFVNKILFTDEATFTRRGIFNYKNGHTWSDENPNCTTVRHFQHEFKFNVWFGIVEDHLLGPVELPATLNGHDYLNFLQHSLFDLLDDVPINRAGMWYLQNGAPAHYTLAVRNHLNNVFSHRWIGRGSEHPWPPRSPDLNLISISGDILKLWFILALLLITEMNCGKE